MRLGNWIALLVVLASPVGASAQGVGKLSLPKTDRQQGLVAGSFLFVPQLSLGVGYDSNLFYEANDEWETPNGVMRMTLTPALSISNRNPGDFRVSLDGSALVNRYFSDDAAVSEQNGVGGELAFRLGLFERSPLVIRLEENFRRVLERRNVESVRDFNRYVNRVGADVVFKPGGGALVFDFGYRFVSDYFSDTEDDWGDLIYHDMRLTGSWRFFPFTAALIEANWQIRDYVADGGHYGELTDNQPLRLRAGLTGFITNRFAVTAMIGWGWSMHDDRVETSPDAKGSNESFSGLLAEVRLGYKWSGNSLTGLSYEHSFEDSLLANYVSRHRFVLGHEQRLWTDLVLNVKGSYTYLDFATLPSAYFYGASGSSDGAYTEASFTRADAVMGLTASIDYDISRWMAVSFSYSAELYNYDFGDRSTVFYVGFEDGTRDYQQYSRHLFMGNVVLRY